MAVSNLNRPAEETGWWEESPLRDCGLIMGLARIRWAVSVPAPKSGWLKGPCHQCSGSSFSGLALKSSGAGSSALSLLWRGSQILTWDLVRGPLRVSPTSLERSE
jgi:hypothetical protein